MWGGAGGQGKRWLLVRRPPASRGTGVSLRGAGRGHKVRFIRRAQPLPGSATPPFHLPPAPRTEDSLPALLRVGDGYLQCRGRRAVKTPLHKSRHLAGREKEVQGGPGACRGRAGAATYLPPGSPQHAGQRRHLAHVLYWRPNDNTEAPQTGPGATNGGAWRAQGPP